MRRLDRLHSVGTLSASMAHEVKNAFVAVRTFVDVLLEKNPQADLGDVVRREMGRIDAIIGQFLKFSRPAAPAFDHIHLHPVLNKSLALIHHLLNERQIEVTRAFAAAPDSLVGDTDQLEQAFLNLFFNAMEAIGKNGRLTVTTSIVGADAEVSGLPPHRTQPYVHVAVQDSGTGILPANMSRLFEPFFTTKPEGTGLGLPMTRRIIQEHHGLITVQSELNRGTRFDVLLPAA